MTENQAFNSEINQNKFTTPYRGLNNSKRGWTLFTVSKQL